MVEHLKKKELWDDYGINPDVVVSKSASPITRERCSPPLQPFTHDFPHADIHELISCDLLHQIIKGTFKDHLVTWIGEYLDGIHGKSKAAKIMADIDRRYVPKICLCPRPHHPDRIAVVPPYPGLRRFKQGRGFNQWTGNDSKALMKVRKCPHYRTRVDDIALRYICRRSKDTYQTTWSKQSPPSWTSVT